ncbi:MAG: hypothetical protein ABSE86_22840 [Bryobacteraceae bacterium]|jgi:hypothetical protein
MRKGPYVFYNQMTGARFRDLKAEAPQKQVVTVLSNGRNQIG